MKNFKDSQNPPPMQTKPLYSEKKNGADVPPMQVKPNIKPKK